MATSSLNLPGGGVITYNNASSGLTATNIQSAIDEVDGNVDTNASSITTINTRLTRLGPLYLAHKATNSGNTVSFTKDPSASGSFIIITGDFNWYSLLYIGAIHDNKTAPQNYTKIGASTCTFSWNETTNTLTITATAWSTISIISDVLWTPNA